MKNLSELIIDFKNKNNLNDNSCSTQLGISIETLHKIEKGTASLTEEERQRILDIISKKSNGKSFTFRKVLDLLFRFGAAVMALVVLLLCINGIAETETLIVLLSIGVVCASIINLPKIDK